MTWVELLRNFFTQASPWFTVRPWEQGVRIFRGKHRRLLGPGFYFKLPVLHSVVVYAIRTRTVYVAMQTLRSKDGRTVMVGLVLRYRIGDLFKVLDSLHNPEAALGNFAQGAVADLVPTLDAAQVQTAALRDAVRKAIAPADYGIEDFDVLVTDNADLSQRTFRLIQEGRWFAPDSEIDKMGRHA